MLAYWYRLLNEILNIVDNISKFIALSLRKYFEKINNDIMAKNKKNAFMFYFFKTTPKQPSYTYTKRLNINMTRLFY